MWQLRRLRRVVQTLALCLFCVALWPALPLAAQTHHYVYLASAESHTISGFELHQSSSTLTAVRGSPFTSGNLASGVTFDPIALAFDPTGHFLFALDSDNSSVAVFSVDPPTGALSELPASPFPVRVGGLGASPRFITIEPTGNFLYIVGAFTSGPQTATQISIYSINSSGALALYDSAPTAAVPFFPIGLVSKPRDQFLYVIAGDSLSTALLTLQLDISSGVLVGTKTNTAAGPSPRSVALAPEGSSLFIGRGTTQGAIDVYPLAADGWMNQPPLAPLTSSLSGVPYELATDYSGAHLYAGAGSIGLIAYSVTNSGVLTPIAGGPFVAPSIAPTDVLAGDPVSQFANIYFNRRAFNILSNGALSEMTAASSSSSGAVSAIAAVSPKDAPITGPVLSLSTTSLQFPQQTVGTISASQSVTLSNTGVAALLLDGISATGDNATDFAISTDDCPASLDPDNTCSVSVVFQPKSGGSRSAALSIADNSPGNPHAVALSGSGTLSTGSPSGPVNPVSAPVLSLSTTSMIFAMQSIGAAAASKSLKLSNTGNGTLVLSGISLSGANASEFALDYDCIAAVLPSAGCTITVNFQPQFQGARAAVLNFVDNAAGGPHTVSLGGTAQLPFAFSADAAAGAVAAGQSAQFTLRLTPAAGFVGHVLLNCSGAPDQSACDLPASLDSNGTSPIAFVVTVSTKPRSSAAPSWRRTPPSIQEKFQTLYLFGVVAVVVLFALLFFVLLARGRRFTTGRRFPETATACACILLVVAMTLTGCGATGATATVSSPSSSTSGSSPTPNPTPSSGTPPGQYSLTITATFGSVTQTVPLALSVT